MREEDQSGRNGLESEIYKRKALRFASFAWAFEYNVNRQ